MGLFGPQFWHFEVSQFAWHFLFWLYDQKIRAVDKSDWLYKYVLDFKTSFGCPSLQLDLWLQNSSNLTKIPRSCLEDSWIACLLFPDSRNIPNWDFWKNCQVLEYCFISVLANGVPTFSVPLNQYLIWNRTTRVHEQKALNSIFFFFFYFDLDHNTRRCWQLQEVVHLYSWAFLCED